MNEINISKLDRCAKALLKDIEEKNSLRSQLKRRFLPEYSEEIIEDALKFLEDEGLITGQKIENLEHYSRITGYYQKVSGWNEGKTQEFKDRHRY